MSATFYQGPFDDSTVGPEFEWYRCPDAWEDVAGSISDNQRPTCPRCRQKTDFIETIYVLGRPRSLCGNCIDFLKTQPRPRPTRQHLPHRAIAPQINRRLMPCNRLGPDATFGRKKS